MVGAALMPKGARRDNVIKRLQRSVKQLRQDGKRADAQKLQDVIDALGALPAAIADEIIEEIEHMIEKDGRVLRQ
jgi:hypothetical protein